ncbi:acVLRF1 family peptidyl-tRNA hydrolase [Nocardioides caeni]
MENFARSHGSVVTETSEGVLSGRAEDGSTFVARLPFSSSYDGLPDDFVAAAVPPPDWGVLLVRKGGFAVARLSADAITASKVGQRHVQGRTKAGGQSQQRFARRRANQAREAYSAAADHAVRILGDSPLVVVGGDRTAVAEVLDDRRLAGVTSVGPWLLVGEPRRAVLESAVADAQAVIVEVVNAGPGRAAPGAAS